MSRLVADTEITCFTELDIFSFSSQGRRPAICPYLRVVAMRQTDDAETHAGRENTEQLMRRPLQLTTRLAQRLLGAMQAIHEGARFNCHSFAHHMAELPPDKALPGGIYGKRLEGNLPLGEIGLVGFAGARPVPHSLVGLGEDVPSSIQVMSRDGALALARNADILSFYSAIFPSRDVGLYPALRPV